MLHNNWKEFQPLRGKTKGVILSLHGLNQVPSDMDDLCKGMADSNYIVIRGALSGHDNSIKNSIVTEDCWSNDTKALIEYGSAIAETNKVNLYTVSFSTGNLCFLNALSKIENCPIKKMVMIAPPIVLTTIGKMARTFSFLPDKMPIPSMDKYNLSTACVQINASYYKAFFDTKNYFHETLNDTHNIPTLLIGHRNDEIINTKRFDSFITKHQLSNWKSLEITDEKFRKDSYFHIIVSSHYWGSTAHKITQNSVFWLDQ